jgi:hypothetical protein
VPKSAKIFGRFYSQTWYSKDREQKQNEASPKRRGFCFLEEGNRRALRHNRHDAIREHE